MRDRKRLEREGGELVSVWEEPEPHSPRLFLSELRAYGGGSRGLVIWVKSPDLGWRIFLAGESCASYAVRVG